MSDATLWTVIIALGVGSFLLRFSFLGFIGGRQMPAWLLRHLRYTAVAILPALVAPMVVWSDNAAGGPELAQIMAACGAVLVGAFTRSTLFAIFTGAGLLVLGLSLGL